MNKKQTSHSVASIAASILSNENSSTIAKQLAASALSQTGSAKQTSSAMAETAAKVLDSSKYSAVTKTLAASILSQS